MLRLDIHHDVLKELQGIDRKHAGQIALKLLTLLSDPRPPDVKALKGSQRDYLRADAGEYRIIYTIEEGVLKVAVIGKRNDDEVYQKLRRKAG